MQTITLVNLLYSLIPLFIVGYFYNKWANNNTEILYSTIRMIVQLLLVGYILIYLFHEKNIYLGIFILMCKKRMNLATNNGNTWSDKTVLFGH